jgi:nitrogen fixation protein NifT
MPSVMLRQTDSGEISFYVAKKDMEETISTLEFDSPEKWGGEVVLSDGSKFYLEPMEPAPKLPITLRAKRL